VFKDDETFAMINTDVIESYGHFKVSTQAGVR
jgi:hypothetical protein